MSIESEALAKMLVWTTLPIPDWAYEAADRILDIDSIEMKVEGWNKDVTRKRIASIIVIHAKPFVALLRESRRKHRVYCDTQAIGCDLKQCTCGADAWNAKVDEALR